MTSLDPRSLLSAESESQTLRALLELRDLLMRGEFKPGERLREIQLAERLGVSRTPARLALERLAHEGLLESRPKGGFEVREFTLQDIRDAIEVRGVLESSAARMAAERLTSDDELAPMRACVNEIDRLVHGPEHAFEELAGYGAINERFHAALIDIAKSPILARAMEQVRALPFAAPSAFTASQAEDRRWRELVTVAQWQHRRIIDAIAARDTMRAAATAREHARIALHSVELALHDKRLSTMPGGSLVRIPGPHDDSETNL